MDIIFLVSKSNICLYLNLIPFLKFWQLVVLYRYDAFEAIDSSVFIIQKCASFIWVEIRKHMDFDMRSC